MHLPISRSIHRHFLKNPFFSTTIDKQFKWIPFAAVFVSDLFHVRTRSDWKKQVLVTSLTEAMRYLVVDNLKNLTDEQRPFPYSGHRSFPSGHTASSFAGAEFMRKELKTTAPVLSWAGYVTAIATATIRLKKNRHWLNDVVVGAAIGIASAKLAYLLINKVAQVKIKKYNNTSEQTEEPERAIKVY